MRRNANANVRLFVVWEPILITDWGKPGASVLARFSDTRVTQIWDREHRIARQMARDARPPEPKPNCCTRNGILWDLAAIYPPGAAWSDALPPAKFIDGPVVKVREQMEEMIRVH